MLEFAQNECDRLPPDLPRLVGELIAANPPPWENGHLTAAANALIDSIEQLLAANGPW